MLLSAAIVLALVVIQRFAASPAPVEKTTEFAPATLPTPPAVPSSPPLSLTELAARPLFTPDRRPLPLAPPTPAPMAAPPPALPPTPVASPAPAPGTLLVLLGIIDVPEGRIAVIRIKSSGEVVRLSEGAAIDRWHLQRIASSRVTLVSGDIAQELDFPSGSERRTGPRPQNSRIPALTPLQPPHS
jgi:hypothetical protein